jgi:hypothetical protein
MARLRVPVTGETEARGRRVSPAAARVLTYLRVPDQPYRRIITRGLAMATSGFTLLMT